MPRTYTTLIFFLFTLLIAEIRAQQFDLAKDVVWSNAPEATLHMDIYSPQKPDESLPVLIIYHGGGWLINNKSIMDEMSAYMATTGKFVVCNVDYRLLTANNNTTGMHEIIEDAMGAVLWIKEHITKYGGDPNRIAVTGDSAGGHLAAMVINGASALGSCGLTTDHLCFSPTFLPEGVTPEMVRSRNMLEVQAAILSYPAVDIHIAAIGNGPGTGFESPSNFFWQMGNGTARGIFGDSINVADHPQLYKAVSPMYTIPEDRKHPPVFLHVGEKDNTTTPESIKAYEMAIAATGAQTLFKIYPGKPHAYLDSGNNEYLGTSFEKDAIIPIEDMITFLKGVFYN
ncbi:alpha/beta hydrolase [Robertkochia sediminum]|uniref:alpha/beta hydrolase n=1 Tax=Robertkochia sediminum TaxID=2785326 RepID=UPI001931CEA9|nr:alpha/beta hydrolase [Robertkochia sediminum]MBL7471795.1 alpha/beta hydrolase [Robertkochia sediminum]